MRFAFAMVLVAGVLPYLTTALAKSGGGYDNAAPRDWVGQLQGWRRRADFGQRFLDGRETRPSNITKV